MEKLTVTGTILICDGSPDSQGDSFPSIDGIEFSDIVPVTRKFDLRQRIGMAKLEKVDDRVKFSFDWQFDAKPPEFALYPYVGGTIKKKDGNKVLECVIEQISLGTTPNADSRIEPVQIVGSECKPKSIPLQSS